MTEEANVRIRVLEELLEGGFDLGLNDGRVEDGDDGLEGASDVEANVGHLVGGHLEDDGEEGIVDDLRGEDRGEDGDGEEGGHAEEVGGVRVERDDARDEV